MLRRPVLLSVGAVAVLAVVGAGRWEAARATHAEQRGIARVFAEAADRPQLDGWRIAAPFRCLSYGRGGEPFAFELCFDSEGRLVEAYDRRGSGFHVWTLRSQPGDATIHASSRAIDALIARMQRSAWSGSLAAAHRYTYPDASLPTTRPPLLRAPRGSGLP